MKIKKKIKPSKIVVFGLGFVGASISTLLARHHLVEVVDTDKSKVDKVNQGLPPVADEELLKSFQNDNLNIKATTSIEDVFPADFAIVCIPTDFHTNINGFATENLKNLIIQINNFQENIPIIIKSTVPIGFTSSMIIDNPGLNLIFSPEFLREGKALYDNQYPSRIIVSNESNQSTSFAEILVNASLIPPRDVNLLFMGSDEAEAVKLFSNSYLAMRVAFFNELDNFAMHKEMDAQQIINGIGFDPRIGDNYNNPSFGYGGYCLPKDSKQLLSQYSNIPNSLIRAIVESNQIRYDFVLRDLLIRNFSHYGIYRINMKSNSDNFRESVSLRLALDLAKLNKKVTIFEPIITEKHYSNIKIEKKLEKFIDESSVIVANRIDHNLENYSHKVYSRDIFHCN